MSVLRLESSLHNQTLSLSSSLSFSLPFKPSSSTLRFARTRATCLPLVTCSVSKVHNYGTVDYERRPIVRWNDVYRRISLNPDPDMGSAEVLNRWENEGKNLTKWELSRVIKELRKYKKFRRALEVYDWINNRPERFRVSESDAAIQLDLIAKVRGFPSAEVFFLSLEDQLKNKRTYGALLNVYVHSRSKEKAESLFDTMRGKGYVVHPLPFNVMMTLYMNVKEYDKVDMLVSEMLEKKIQLDIYTYNIWLSSCGSQGSIEKMEQVFEQMEKDPTIIPNWSTFSTMASMYIRMDQTEKAEECLRKVEDRIKGRDRIPFHYLLSLYGRIGNKDEIYRVWNIYKSVFPKNTPNLGYHAVISSLVKVDDIAGAEKLYKEWVSVKLSYDPRVGNLLLDWYVEAGDMHKALSFFKQMKEDGGFPNSNTWEILSEGYIADKRISEALSCLKEAFMVANDSRSWRPKPLNLSAFLELCQEQGDLGSADTLTVLLKLSKFSKYKAYESFIGSSDDELSSKINTVDRTDDMHGSENMDGDSELLLNELESSF
ncbi:hypothetical protein LR48_Vigan11g163600 [Vigna angularis]|uniref:Pentacotripeptide-repeat region of PRORP domain-containing protein n=2 Tax=Phaseolus angularis TaxID=3914 RepID=A0A0L9VUT7_PHAAN|nr:pentatricopeptide repeat-containing protein At1g02150 [Vigna angularis]KOM58602.1 hypothetical protein LR48_Vigan11g163600 [Vigna angularis]BAT96847.1 hypothetical protein VIGAN_09015500 [Vigna angularis var. angularis]